MDESIAQEVICDYNPNRLLNVLREYLRLKNDAGLSLVLEVSPPVISKIRHRKVPVGGALLIRMHEVTGLNIIELRDLMGDRRSKFRISDVHGRPKIDDIPVATWPTSANVSAAAT